MTRTVSSISYGGRRRHVQATYNHKRAGWFLQTAHPTPHGHRFDPPHAGPFTTKKLAEEAKRNAR